MGGRVAVPVAVAEEVLEAVEEAVRVAVAVEVAVLRAVRVPTWGEGVAEGLEVARALVVGEPLTVKVRSALPVPLADLEGEEEAEGEAVEVEVGGGMQYPREGRQALPPLEEAAGDTSHIPPPPQVPL